MKFKQLRHRCITSAQLLLGSALFALVWSPGVVSGANLFWNNTTPNWDGGAPNLTWDALADLSSANQLWNDNGLLGSDANFQTAGGATVNIIGGSGPVVSSISASSPGASAWVINGGTVRMAGGGSISAGAGDTLTINSILNGAAAGQALNFTAGGGVVVVNGNIGSNIGNLVSNAPDLTLAGNNSFTGSLSVQSGVTKLAGGVAVPNTSAVDLTGSATVVVSASEAIGNLSGTAGTTLQLGGVLTVNQTPAPVVPPFPPAHLTYAGTITGVGGLIKNGPATLGLTGNNNYSGVTTVNTGALLIGSGSALGATGPGNNTVINSGGTVAIQTSGVPTLFGEDFTIVGAGDTAGGYLGAIHNVSGNNTIGPVGGGTGLITMTGVPATIHSDAGTLEIKGGITSTVVIGNDIVTFSVLGGSLIDVNSVIDLNVEGIVKTGLGTLDLTGQNNDYVLAPGIDTVIREGQILVDSDLNLGNGTNQSGGVEFNGVALALPTLHVINNNIDFGATDRYFTITGPIGQFNIDSGLTATIKNSELSFGNPGNILRKIGKGTLIIDATQPGIGFTTTINGTLDPDDGTLTVWGAGHSGVTPVAAPGCVPAAGTTTLVLKGLGDDPLALTPVIGTPTTGLINLGTVAHAFDNIVIQQTNNGTFNGTLTTTGDLYIRNGTGTLTLGGNNSIDGNVHIAGTQLIISSPNALGDWALTHDSRATFICGTTNIPAGDFAGPSSAGLLSLTNNITLNERITIVNNGRLDNLSGNNILNSELRVLFNGSIPYDIGSTPDDARIGATTGILVLVNGIFSDPASININGLATDTGTVGVWGQIQNTVVNVSMGNTANATNTVALLALNSYTGQTIFNGGNVFVGNNGALSSSQVLVNAPTHLDGTAGPVISIANPIALNSTLTVGNSNNSLILSGTISGTGGPGMFFTEGIVKVGSGTVLLGGTNTYLGATMVDAGTLIVSGSLNSSTVQVRTAGGTLQTTGAEKLADATSLFVVLGGTATLGGNETVNAVNIYGTLNSIVGNLTTSGLYGGGTGIINLASNILTVQDSGLISQYSGTLVGVNGSLVKNGAGVLTLTGNNSGLTGSTTVNNGTLALQGLLGTTTVNVGALGTLTTNAAGLLPATAALTTSGTVTLGGAQTVASLNVNAASGIVNLGNGNLTTTTLNGIGTINLAANTLVASSGLYAGTINGTSGGLDKNGLGTLTLSGNNAYTGPTNVNGGVLELQSALASVAVTVTATGTLTTSGPEQLANATVLAANGLVSLGGNETITTLNGGGTVALGASTLTLQDGTFAGSINGTGGLTKTNAGTLTLNGINGYTGATNVNGGSLTLGGSLASLTINVASGAALNTNALGALADSAALSNNGTVNLGVAGNEVVGTYASTGGTLTGVAGSTLTASTYALNNGAIVSTNLGTGILTSNGTVTLGTVATTIGASSITVQSGTLTTAGTILAANISVQTLATMNATGTYSATNINVAGGGTLNVNHLFAPTATVNASGIVNVNTGPNTIANLNINAASGAVNLLSGNLTTSGLNGGGTISLNGNTLTASSGAYSGTINGAGGLTKAGLPTDILTLSGTNAFTGALNVNAGTLDLQSALASLTVNVGAGATLSTSASEQLANTVVLLANGTVNLGGNETIGTLNGAGVINIGASTLTIQNGGVWNGAINGSGLTYITGGTLTVSGALESDLIHVKSGVTLTTTGANLLGNSSALNNDGTVNLGGNDTVASYASTGTLNGPGTLTAATYALNSGSVVNTNLGTGIITTNGTVTLGTALTTVGASAITVQTGTLDAAGTFLATNINVNSGSTLNSNGILALNATLAVSGTANIQSTSTIGALDVNAASGVVNLVAANLTTGGLNGGGTINLNANSLSAASGLYSGTLTGTGSLTKTGLGTLTLSGTNNYTGATYVNAGTLSLHSALASTNVNVTGTLSTSAAEQLADATVLTMSGTVNLGGNETITTLNGAGNVNLGASTLTLQNGAFAGSINGTGGVTKTGAGLLILSSSNAYTGATEVTGGTLSVGGALASTSLHVGAAGTLSTSALGVLGDSATLSNDGIVNLVVAGVETVGTYSSHGTLNGPGTLNASTYNLNDGSVVNTGLGNAATPQHGVIITNGNVTLAGGNTYYSGSLLVQTGNLTASGTYSANQISVSTGAILDSHGILASTATLTVSGEANMLAATTTVKSLAVIGSGTVNLAGGDLSTVNLSGDGTINMNSRTLTVEQGSFDGSITGTLASVLNKNGAGVLTLSGAQSFTGTANVNLGTLVAQTALGASTVNVANNATYRNVGGLLNPGVVITNAGTVTLFGNEQASVYTSTGTLNGTGLTGVAIFTAGTYNLNGGSVVGEHDAFGQLRLGTGTINSNGAVSLFADSLANVVHVQSGVLNVGGNLGSPNALVTISSGAVLNELLDPSFGINADIANTATVNNAGTLTLSDDDLIAHYISGGPIVGNGLLNGTGTLTALDYALNDHTVVALGANLGTGAVTSNGNVLLNGNSYANSVLVQTGTLTVNNHLGSPNATIDILSGAALADNGNIVDTAILTNAGTMILGVSDTIASYTSGGVNVGDGLLTGTGTLTALNYMLNNHSVVTAGANLGTGNLYSNGTVLLSGNSAANFVNVQSGTLTIEGLLGSANADVRISSGATLVDKGNIVDTAMVTNAGRLTLWGNETIGSYLSGGSNIGDGALDNVGTPHTLQAATYALGNNSVVSLGANLGTGALTSNGTVVINSNSAANSVAVQSGTLTFSGLLGSSGATISISSGARLVDNGNIVDNAIVTNAGRLTLSSNETIGSYTSGGSLAGNGLLDGTGTLQAATYALNNNSVVAAGANLGTGVLTSNGTVLLNGNSAAGTINVQTGTLTSTAVLGVATVGSGSSTIPGSVITLSSGAALTSTSSGSLLASLITVNSSATLTSAGVLSFDQLQGNGTVVRSTLNNITRVTPGVGNNNIGTLTVVGNYAGIGTLEIDIDGNPGRGVISDKLVVTGNANLTGGTLKLVKSFYEMGGCDKAQVISAGSYTGQLSLFDRSAFTDVMVFDNGTGTVYGVGVAKGLDLGDRPGLNSNQQAIAHALSSAVLRPSGFVDQTLPLDAAFLAVLSDCDQAAARIDLLSPESYAGLSDYGLQVTRNYTRTAMGVPGSTMVAPAPAPVAEAKGGMPQPSAKGAMPPAPAPAASGTTAFAAYSHYDGGATSSNNNADYDLNSNGGMVGVRHSINNLTFGGFVAADEGAISSAYVNSDVTGFLIGGFVSYVANTQRNFVIDGGLTYGNYDFDGTRQTINGIAQFNGVGSDVFDLFVSMKGDLYRNDTFRVTPMLGLHYLQSNVDQIRETGAGSALGVDSMDEDAFLAELSLNFEYKVVPTVKLLGNLGYTHNFVDSERNLTSSFIYGGSAFNTLANGMGEDHFSAGIGASWDVTTAFVLGAGYRAEFGSNSKASNSLGVSASYSF